MPRTPSSPDLQEVRRTLQLSTSRPPSTAPRARSPPLRRSATTPSRGPTPNDIAQAPPGGQVRAALGRRRAYPPAETRRSSLRSMASSAPSTRSSASSSARRPPCRPIVLLTPDRLVLKMDVGETDYANIKLGQAGGVFFDSIPGKIYPFVITEIGLSPSITQGVMTYHVKASLIVAKDAPRPAPGMNARGQIITDSRKDVLVVPPRAIHRSGNNQVVDVRRNGAVEEQVITTGVSDDNNVEILSGLSGGRRRRRRPPWATRARPHCAGPADPARRREVESTVIKLRGISKTYKLGSETVHALQRRRPGNPRWRVHGHHGAIRIRQVNADEHHRLPRSPDAKASTSSMASTCSGSATRSSRTCATAASASSSSRSTCSHASTPSTRWRCRSRIAASPNRKKLADGRAQARRPRQPHAPPSHATVRRPAAARRHRPRDRRQADHHPRRRTDGRPRHERRATT